MVRNGIGQNGIVSQPPEFLSFDVGGTTVGALRWNGISGAPTIVAIHGITANAWSWDPVAHQLAGGAHLVAIDLRGRGRSHNATGPFGMRPRDLEPQTPARVYPGRSTDCGDRRHWR